MPKPQRRFTQDFQDEAVRLAETSGRSRHEIAEDLGLSTLRHWIDRRWERRIEQPPQEHQEDMAAALKRLRRENEILRQERDILQEGRGFFRQGGKSMRFWLIDVAKEDFSPVQGFSMSAPAVIGRERDMSFDHLWQAATERSA